MISVVLKRAWKSIKTDVATRIFLCCERSAVHGKRKIDRQGICSFWQLIFLHVTNCRRLSGRFTRGTPMKCMRSERASAGMSRESASLHACSTNPQKRRSISAAVCGLGNLPLEQKLKKVEIEVRVQSNGHTKVESLTVASCSPSQGRRLDDSKPWRLGPSARLRSVQQYTNKDVTDAASTSELNFRTTSAKRRDAERPFAKALKITIESIA